MKVFYLGYYGTLEYVRNGSPAAATMMDYVAQSVKTCSCDVTIISPAQSEVKCGRIFDEKKEIDVVYLPSYGHAKGIVRRAINKIQRSGDLYKELIDDIDENTILIVYHSLAYIDVLNRVRKKKRFRLILQVNEIYSDVTGDRKSREQELVWINSADAYLFSTDLLRREVTDKNKPYLVCLGTYKEELEVQLKKRKEGEIHMVYAGTFDETKGGVQRYFQCKVSSIELPFTYMRLWKWEPG